MSYFVVGIGVGVIAIVLLIREAALGFIDYRVARALKKHMEANNEN